MTENSSSILEYLRAILAADIARYGTLSNFEVPAGLLRNILDELVELRTRTPDPSVDRLREAAESELEWIAAFAAIRSQDSQRVAAKVNRGAMENISNRCRNLIAALSSTNTSEGVVHE